jgi:hypothetical protein
MIHQPKFNSYSSYAIVIGGISRGPSASEHRRISVPAPAMVSVLSHMRFSHRRSVLRPLFRTLHSLLGYQRPSACFDLSVCLQPVCLSLFCRSDWLVNPIACASFPSPALSVDSLDSELWYHFGSRAAALASSSTLAVGQSFRQLSTMRSALQG